MTASAGGGSLTAACPWRFARVDSQSLRSREGHDDLSKWSTGSDPKEAWCRGYRRLYCVRGQASRRTPLIGCVTDVRGGGRTMKPPRLHRDSRVRLRQLSSLLCLSLSAGCSVGGAHREASVGEGWDGVGSPDKVVEVRYSMLGQGSEGPRRGDVDVVSAGSLHVRLDMKVNNVESRYVYDGRRLLVHDPRHDIPYMLYESPGEHPEALAVVRSWRLDPASEVFAHLCMGAQKVAKAPTIAGRTAVGYSCRAPKHHLGGEGTMWLDRDTGVLLRNDAFQAREVTPLPELDASTFFSTEPPPGAKVRRLPAYKGPHVPARRCQYR